VIVSEMGMDLWLNRTRCATKGVEAGRNRGWNTLSRGKNLQSDKKCSWRLGSVVDGVKIALVHCQQAISEPQIRRSTGQMGNSG